MVTFCLHCHRPTRVEETLRAMSSLLSCPLTVKMRMGKKRSRLNAHEYLPRLKEWGVVAATLHGRTKEQRYTQTADWEYIEQVAASCSAAAVFSSLFSTAVANKVRPISLLSTPP